MICYVNWELTDFKILVPLIFFYNWLYSVFVYDGEKRKQGNLRLNSLFDYHQHPSHFYCLRRVLFFFFCYTNFKIFHRLESSLTRRGNFRKIFLLRESKKVVIKTFEQSNRIFKLYLGRKLRGFIIINIINNFPFARIK